MQVMLLYKLKESLLLPIGFCSEPSLELYVDYVFFSLFTLPRLIFQIQIISLLQSLLNGNYLFTSRSICGVNEINFYKSLVF